MRGFAGIAALVVAIAATVAGSAVADSTGPIDFEPGSGYTVGDINGQQGWSKTGGYDVAVAAVSSFPDASGYSFGTQALRLSDATTTGAFGDQTFSPGLTQAAGEAPAQTHFTASFRIGTTSSAVQPGLHLSVSPDDGNGARMSYLRFEDQSDGVHVFFDDATDHAPVGTVANFSDTDIATLSRSSAHTVKFDIGFRTNAPDVVNIYIDGVLKKTGTTWEDYYRFDPEQTPSGNQVPLVSKLLFREAGDAHSTNAGRGFLVDGVSLSSSSSPVCTPTGLMRDGLNLTAAQIGGDVSGTLDATGCNIGVYYPDGSTGSVTNADIFGANYYGVVADGAAVNVTNSSIHDIGETPFNGSQHGVGVLYTTVHQDNGTTAHAATGTLSGSTITRYQKNGVVVSGNNAAVTVQNNTVTGNGPVDYIAQNGIQISFGATASVIGNTVSGHFYTPATVTACGLLYFQAGGVKQKSDTLFANQTNVCNAGRGGGHFNP
jgi:parallel beta helix pectate lyase-like protein